MLLGSRRVRIWFIDRKRLILLLILVLLFIILLILVQKQQYITYGYYYIGDFSSRHLSIYFETAYEEEVSWHYLAAVDRAEGISDVEVNYERSGKIARYLKGVKKPDEAIERLKLYKNDDRFINKLKMELRKFDYLVSVYEDKVFPIAPGYGYDYEDGYGDPRTYGGERSHEGIDIMCDIGTPLVSVCDGVIEKMGWLELGGWRIGIRGEDGVYYYYAHLSEYRDGLEKGDKVKKGELIGYAGDTGYGPEGTSGEFLPHLHFGMYERQGFVKSGERAVNPFPFLKAWEKTMQDKGG